MYNSAMFRFCILVIYMHCQLCWCPHLRVRVRGSTVGLSGLLRVRVTGSPAGRLTSGNLTTWLILVYTVIYLDILCASASWVIRCYHNDHSITQYEIQPSQVQGPDSGSEEIVYYISVYTRLALVYDSDWPKVYLRIYWDILLANRIVCPSPQLEPVPKASPNLTTWPGPILVYTGIMIYSDILCTSCHISKPRYHYNTIITFWINYIHYNTIITLL